MCWTNGNFDGSFSSKLIKRSFCPTPPFLSPDQNRVKVYICDVNCFDRRISCCAVSFEIYLVGIVFHASSNDLYSASI